ncbi:Target of EGR1, member 1 (Nuclear) [Nowakowskiella sp. JEL0078]|nr:Target of EGR1, member 1 (Nuclear) [Nowakowskiella sp. JEL0078]
MLENWNVDGCIRKYCISRNIEDRYKALSHVAKNYALVAFGVSIFELTKTIKSQANTKPDPSVRYDVHNFNFTLVRARDYVVCPSSLSFLMDNGFDFERQVKEGIYYLPGNEKVNLKDQKDEEAAASNVIMRSLFDYILARKVPISFYTELPAQLDSFAADLSDMFPAGIFDTKYVADYHTREEAEREQARRRFKAITNSTPVRHFLVCKSKDELPGLEEMSAVSKAKKAMLKNELTKKPSLNTGKPFCEQFAGHGFCPKGRYCDRTHNLDIILDYEERKLSGALKDSEDQIESAKKRMRLEMYETNEFKLQNIGETSMKELKITNTYHNEEEKRKEENKPEITTQLESKVNTELAIVNIPEISKKRIANLPSDGSLFECFHSAWFDSYMTGFVFARQCLVEVDRIESEGSSKIEIFLGDSSSDEKYQTFITPDTFKNKLYLMGKEMPLNVTHGNFAKNSKGHLERMKLVKNK